MDNGIANYTNTVLSLKILRFAKLSSPALKHELNFGKEKLIRMVNEKFDKEVIKKIVIS